MATTLNLTITQGDTFIRIFRWETTPFIYKAITGITKAAPAVLTVPSHGIPDGWRAGIVSVLGMTQINAKHTPPRTSEMKAVTVLDTNTVSVNTINSAGFSAYTSGGYLQYYTPVDLTGYTARMTIKDRVGGSILMTCTVGAPDTRIVVSNTNKTVTLTITAVDTAAITWRSGVYDFEMVSPAGVVTKLYSGSVSVTKEVTT